jgi:hypothetical protein
MQISPVTVLAQKPDFRNIWLRAATSFLLTIAAIGGMLYYITSLTSHISDVALYFIILVPFLVFMSYMRISMRRAAEVVQVTITENGIYQKPLKMSGIEIFTPWTYIKKIEERIHGSNEGAPYISLHLQKPKETLIVSSSEIGLDPFKHFLSTLRKFRSALGAVNN